MAYNLLCATCKKHSFVYYPLIQGYFCPDCDFGHEPWDISKSLLIEEVEPEFGVYSMEYPLEIGNVDVIKFYLDLAKVETVIIITNMMLRW